MNILSSTQFAELDNGVQLCCFRRRGVSVELQIHIASGSIHEAGFLGCGLSHFLEHMAFQGCRNFPGHAIADTVNTMGGDVNAYTGYDRTCYRMQLPREFWRKGVEMLSSMVRFPELPDSRFAAEREVILRECERGMDNPDRRLHEKFMRTMFAAHPLRHPVIGYKEMIAEVTREMALEYHSARYTPDRCVVVAVGDIDFAGFSEAVSELLGDWKRSHLAESVLPDDPLPAACRCSELIFPDPHERLFMGCRLPGFGDPELPALELLFGVLGTGESSMLNRALIMDNPLGIGIHSFCYSLGKISLGGISGRCEPGKMSRFRSGIMRQLESAAKGRISRSHVEREKGQQFADHLRGLRDPVNIAGEIAGGVIYDRNPGAADMYLEYLQKTGIDEVKQAAAKYLDLSRWAIVHQHSRPANDVRKSQTPAVELNRVAVSGGMQLFHAPDKQLPLCTFFLVMPGGALHEPVGKAGVSSLTAALLTAGCGKYNEAEFLRKLDETGAEFEVSSGANSITMEFTLPKRKMTAAVNLICSMLAEPHFEAAAVEREKIRALELLKARAADPFKSAYDCAVKKLFGSHPYSWAKCGTAADISRLDRDEIAGFYRNCRSSLPVICGFAGDCTASDAAGWGEMISASLIADGTALSRPPLPGFAADISREQIALAREQTVVLRMLPGVRTAESDDIDILEILHQAENGLASNLFKSVREDHALSYSVGMSFFAGFHPGAISFYAMTADGAGEKVMGLLNDEIGRLGKRGLSEEEFEAARRGQIFDLDRSFDSADILLRTAVMDAYYGRCVDDLYSRKERIRSMSCEEFNAAVKKYFASPAGVEVLVVPEKK
ncbi:MAG: insulinase family protein [Lentisphaerae bacterium]|nr:insulinase family protein [Lentisphaerota bacterium]